MPTYEYSCPQGHEFERFLRKISDGRTEVPCPECGAIATRKISRGGGLVFKGSGFYLTDYGRNAHNKKEEGKSTAGDKPTPPGEAKASPASEAKSEAKSEGKSETKSESTSAKPAEKSASANPRQDSKKPKPKE
jgi:putative FmdB family regulatory protein